MAKDFFPTAEFSKLMSPQAQSALRKIQSLQVIEDNVTILQGQQANDTLQINAINDKLTVVDQNLEQLNTNTGALGPPWTDGQLLIGNTSEDGADKATLTAGAEIGIVNAGGSITIKVATGAASVLVGRGSAAGAGDAQEIALGTNLSMSGTTLNATGGGSLTTSVANCSADIALTTSFRDVTGCSLSLAAGTYLILATVVATDATFTNTFSAKIYNNTDSVDYVEGAGTMVAGGWNTVSLSCIIVLAGTKTIRIAAIHSNTTVTVKQFGNFTGANVQGTLLQAIKIG